MIPWGIGHQFDWISPIYDQHIDYIYMFHMTLLFIYLFTNVLNE